MRLIHGRLRYISRKRNVLILLQLIWKLIERGSDMESFRNKKSLGHNTLVPSEVLKTTVQSWQITYTYCNCKSQWERQHLQAALSSSSLKGLRYNDLYIIVQIKQCFLRVCLKWLRKARNIPNTRGNSRSFLRSLGDVQSTVIFSLFHCSTISHTC